MFEPLSMSAFFAISVLLALSPGPDNLYVFSLSLTEGIRAGIWVIVGLCLGLIVHTAMVAGGVSTVIAANAQVMTVIKFVGIAYLLYLAFLSFRSSAASELPVPVSDSDRFSRKSHVLKGVVMNLSNPKIILFFLAFLPQYADPDRGSVFVQLIVYGLVFVVAAFLVFCGIAQSAEWLNRRFVSARGGALNVVFLQRASGVVLLVLAASLLFSGI